MSGYSWGSSEVILENNGDETMKLTLKQWRTIETKLKEVKRAIESADCAVFDIAKEFDAESPESALVMELWKELHELRGVAPVTYMYHPQSEWMGGDSDKPESHRLREPNAAPMPRRYFTAEEIAEANAECHGPCDWTYQGAK